MTVYKQTLFHTGHDHACNSIKDLREWVVSLAHVFEGVVALKPSAVVVFDSARHLVWQVACRLEVGSVLLGAFDAAEGPAVPFDLFLVQLSVILLVVLF